MGTRHQAASIDEMKTELTLPRSIARHPIFYRIGEALKSLFVAQMWVEDSSNTSQEILKLRANVSRTGEEAQFEAEIAGSKYHIRIPYLLKGVFPMSLRNPVGFNILQKLTRHQIPASCRVEPQYIWTFDNKTYSYELNNCFHLLFKDCTQQIPVAVLAKNVLNSEKKEVKILSGVTELLMTPDIAARQNLKLKLNVEGQERELLAQPGQVEQVIARSEGTEEVIMRLRGTRTTSTLSSSLKNPSGSFSMERGSRSLPLKCSRDVPADFAVTSTTRTLLTSRPPGSA